MKTEEQKTIEELEKKIRRLMNVCVRASEAMTFNVYQRLRTKTIIDRTIRSMSDYR